MGRKKLFFDFRRWFAASDPHSIWLRSRLAFCLSLLLATFRQMYGGAIPMSRCRQLVLVGFRHSAMMQELSLISGSIRRAFVDGDNAGQVYAAA